MRIVLVLFIVLTASFSYGQDSLVWKSDAFKNKPPKGITEGLGGFEDESENKLVNRLFGPRQFDSRVEVWQLDSTYRPHNQIRSTRTSVAMIVEKTQLLNLGDGTVQLLPVGTLQQVFQLCSYEPFVEQFVVGLGTAFLIGSDTLCSALHVFQSKLSNYSVVFGYERHEAGDVSNLIIPEDDVYDIVSFVDGGNEDQIDIAVFTIDRPADRPILKWSETFTINDSQEIYSIGYPLGLPAKIAVNAHIIDNTEYEHFYTSLDAFRGNSGSPVFRIDTHEVVGVLVSGQPEFYLSGNCNISKGCSLPDCRGERIVRSERILEEIFGRNE